MTCLTKCDHHVQYLVRSDESETLVCLICYVEYLQAQLDAHTAKVSEVETIEGDQHDI